MGVRAADERRIEVLAQDLPCFLGAQLAIDITLRCALSSSGETHPNAADGGGVVLARGRVDKQTTYSELLTGRCRLVVLAIDWLLLKPERFLLTCGFPRRSCGNGAGRGCCRRRVPLFFASSLVEPSGHCTTWCWIGGEPPSLAELLGQDLR